MIYVTIGLALIVVFAKLRIRALDRRLTKLEIEASKVRRKLTAIMPDPPEAYEGKERP